MFLLNNYFGIRVASDPYSSFISGSGSSSPALLFKPGSGFDVSCVSREAPIGRGLSSHPVDPSLCNDERRPVRAPVGQVQVSLQSQV